MAPKLATEPPITRTAESENAAVTAVLRELGIAATLGATREQCDALDEVADALAHIAAVNRRRSNWPPPAGRRAL